MSDRQSRERERQALDRLLGVLQASLTPLRAKIDAWNALPQEKRKGTALSVKEYKTLSDTMEQMMRVQARLEDLGKVFPTRLTEEEIERLCPKYLKKYRPDKILPPAKEEEKTEGET